MREAIIFSIERNTGLIQRTLADFADEDMLTRPAPGANHVAWQLGHLILSDRHGIEANKPELLPALPEGYEKLFAKDMVGNDDSATFPKKEELLRVFGEHRAAVLEMAKTLTDDELKRAMPQPIFFYAPTALDLLISTPVHAAMHLGQFQVARRLLKKPILF